MKKVAILLMAAVNKAIEVPKRAMEEEACDAKLTALVCPSISHRKERPLEELNLRRDGRHKRIVCPIGSQLWRPLPSVPMRKNERLVTISGWKKQTAGLFRLTDAAQRKRASKPIGNDSEMPMDKSGHSAACCCQRAASDPIFGPEEQGCDLNFGLNGSARTQNSSSIQQSAYIAPKWFSVQSNCGVSLATILHKTLLT
jgi:hypothetical protein